jgi:hypothetical protein
MIKSIEEKTRRITNELIMKSMNKDMKNHPYLNHSKQKIEIVKAHVLHPKSSFLHMTRERERERERDVQVLDPKGLAIIT